MKSLSPFTLLAALFLLLGFVLRVYGLDIQSLWNDELSALMRSGYDSWWQVFQLEHRLESHPPGYNTLLFFLTSWFGDDAALLRLPSAVAGTVLIYGMYRLGTVLFSRREGALAAGLMAVLLTPVYASQEARPYAIMMMFAVFATVYYVEILEAVFAGHTVRRRAIALYVINATLCSYFHYFGLAYVGLQGIFALVLGMRNRSLLRITIAIGAALFVLYLPALRIFFAQFADPTAFAPQAAPTPVAFYRFALYLFNWSPWFAGVALLAVMAWAGLAVTHLARRPREVRKIDRQVVVIIGLAVWALVPIVATYLFSHVKTPIFMNRYLVVSLPAVYLLVSRAIMRIPLRQSLQVGLVVGIVGYAAVDLVGNVRYYTTVNKQQFREAAAYVVDHDRPALDAPIVCNGFSEAYFDYYFAKLDYDKRCALRVTMNRTEALRQLVEEDAPRNLWVVWGHFVPQPTTDYMRFILGHFAAVEEQQYYRAGAVLFRRLEADHS